MMQSPRQVLNDLWVHGADARITREGRLRVEPASQLPVELVEAIRADISGLITELRSGWTPEKEGWSRVPTDRVPPALNTTPEWWERLLHRLMRRVSRTEGSCSCSTNLLLFPPPETWLINT